MSATYRAIQPIATGRLRTADLPITPPARRILSLLVLALILRMPTAHAEDQAKQGVTRLGEHPAVIVARRGVLVDPTSKFNLHPALMSEPSVKMPAEQYQGSVRFVTGGVGQDEAKMFEKELSKHPLAIELLEHAGKTDEFTAHAMVKIADQHGHTVLEAKADGPFMLVDLPPGRYSIQATLNNTTLKKSGVMVAHDKKARVMFEFPAHADA